MENLQIPIEITKTLPKNRRERLKVEFKRIVFTEKLLNIWGIAFLLLASSLLAIVIVQFGIPSAILLLAAIIGLPTLYAIIIYPKFGIITLLIAAYFVMWFIRMGINFPLGTLMDGLQVLLIFGFFLKQKFHPNWKIYKNPISILILIWIAYNFLEFFNPVAASQMAWIYTVRTVAFVMLMYFVFMYHITTVQFIRLIIKIWLVLSLFAAFYALKQEFIGFFDFEDRSIQTELFRSLLFIEGHWRKFSIFSDPVAFSYNMVMSSILCFALLWGPISALKKSILIGLMGIFLFSMLYSGTRSAYVLFPAALVLFAILKLNKKVLLVSLIGVITIGVLIVIPTSNQTLKRFQSAFNPSEDASFNARKVNQARIQPYIQSHSMGGGLGSTGVWGQRFAPDSYLAKFPPDGGYVRVAVEMGWIGLLLFCTLMFVILKTGISNYFQIKNPELKTYCLAMTLILFAYNIGNYPQEALVQFPSNIFFYMEVALINITLRLDQQLQAKKEPKV